MAIVETEIGSDEGVNQLSDYRTWAMRRFGHDWRFSLLFLTNHDGIEVGGNPLLPDCGDRSFAALRRAAERRSTEQSIWDALTFACLAALLAAIADDPGTRPTRGPASSSEYSFIGSTSHPTRGCFAPLANSPAERDGAGIAALLDARASLRKGAIKALAPDLAAIGLRLKVDNWEGISEDVLELIDSETHADAGRDLAIRLNVWHHTPAIMIHLRRSAVPALGPARDVFFYKGAGRG